MQEKYEIKLSVKAKNDLKNIVLYIKNNIKEPTIARKYAQLIKKEINNLEYYPQKHEIIDIEIIKYLKIRKLNIKNYIVFYRINSSDKVVNIERILYSGSNWINEI